MVDVLFVLLNFGHRLCVVICTKLQPVLFNYTRVLRGWDARQVEIVLSLFIARTIINCAIASAVPTHFDESHMKRLCSGIGRNNLLFESNERLDRGVPRVAFLRSKCVLCHAALFIVKLALPPHEVIQGHQVVTLADR